MKTRLLYFYTDEATFVDKDVRILSEQYEVIKRRFDVSKKWKLPFSFLKQLTDILRFAPGAKWMVVQFGGYHSFLPSVLAHLFGTRTAIVLGGYDCVSFPEIRYGAFFNKWMKPFVKRSYSSADLLLPVHEALVYKTYHFFDAQNKAQGFEAHAGKVKARCVTIYNGYDADKWLSGEGLRETSFITVAGGCEEKRRRILKGVDSFIELAKRLPQHRFTIVGANNWGEHLPENLLLIPRTKNEELKELYQSHKFYVQLSLSEGFPNALSEAMLCGCVPIVSDVASMPDLVNGAGYILKHKDVNELELLAKTAIAETKPEQSSKARANIAERYTEERRHRELLQILNKA